jgi:hypothetical protein
VDRGLLPEIHVTLVDVAVEAVKLLCANYFHEAVCQQYQRDCRRRQYNRERPLSYIENP